MKNINFALKDEELLAVNGGVQIDFMKIKKVAEKINAGNASETLSYNWSDRWSDHGYWE